MDIKEADILGESIYSHWYYVSKARAVKRLTTDLRPRSILDVGAGSGVFSRILLESTSAESSICVDPGYESDRDDECAGKALAFRRSVDDASADLVLFMDVLEHVDDDVAFLDQYSRSMAPGSHVLITVPAFQFLFSGHDVFLEHRRRYTIRSLESVTRRAGLEIVTSRYFFAFLFPVVVCQRLLNRALTSSGRTAARSALRRHSPVVNSLLTAIHAVELSVFRLNRLAGLSVFCLARIPADRKTTPA
jgi:2-polyprenyl-3-methyl-5-hydroxy-6-metoxy-1,4-benzoquinol methylase